MSSYGGDRRIQMESSRHHQLAEAARTTARSASDTMALTEQLVKASRDAELRELKMLFWTRVAGIGALLALLVSVIGIAITIAVS